MRAVLSPGTIPQVCPVDSIVNTHPVRQLVNEITLEILDPCVWRYVLNQDDLASFRLNARSDVIGVWEVETTTYHNNHLSSQGHDHWMWLQISHKQEQEDSSGSSVSSG